MSGTEGTRRDFLKAVGAGAAALSLSGGKGTTVHAMPRASSQSRLRVDPEPRFSLSPWLYMQFMEPLGTTDGSVAAAWDFGQDRWRPDVIEATKELAPTMMRWGGCFIDYYRWREAVGPRDKRVPMLNMCWGGLDTNQIGTHEFVDLCRAVNADPLMCVNFECDGRENWKKDPKGSDRFGTAQEAAEWVRYCNDPDDRERRRHGHNDPYNIKMWQIGNETSFDRKAFSAEEAARKTAKFAKAMRREDPSIELIGWGDLGWQGEHWGRTTWVKPMIEMAGEHLQYVAFHDMFDPRYGQKDSPLRGVEYRKDPDRTWAALMDAWKVHEGRIKRIREDLDGYDLPMAMTECHFALPGRNRCEVLSSWAAGVANARLANLHERHGDKLKIATLADFCGTRWQVNAIMIPVPGGRSFMMPVARVMSLYRQHTGENAVAVTETPGELDATASVTGKRAFLHVVNTNRTRPVNAELAFDGRLIRSGRVFTLAAEPEYEVLEYEKGVLEPTEHPLPVTGRYTFPAASVSAVEVELIDPQDMVS